MESHTVPPTETVDPAIDRIFEDARNGELLRVVYEDSRVVLLRSSFTQQDGSHVHRHESRSDFEKQIKADRLKHAPDADVNIPPAKRHSSDEEVSAEGGGAVVDDNNNVRIDTFADSSDQPDNEANDEPAESPPESEKREVAGEAEQTGSTDTPSSERGEWADVDAIGPKTAENLYEHGYETPADIRSASTSELRDVPLLGTGGIENLREHINE
jgi:predicted flap endonuclease-1-like 5' DNA nuclease